MIKENLIFPIFEESNHIVGFIYAIEEIQLNSIQYQRLFIQKMNIIPGYETIEDFSIDSSLLIEQITIADKCGLNTNHFRLENLDYLQDLVIGDDCFNFNPSGRNEEIWRMDGSLFKYQNRSFTLKKLPRLNRIVIGVCSFQSTTQFELQGMTFSICNFT